MYYVYLYEWYWTAVFNSRRTCLQLFLQSLSVKAHCLLRLDRLAIMSHWIQCKTLGEQDIAVCSFLDGRQHPWHKFNTLLITVFLLAFHRPLTRANLLTLPSSCSISTVIVSNILSWVELLRSGVVSDLEEGKTMNEGTTKRLAVQLN